jgi:hypothetical protein
VSVVLFQKAKIKLNKNKFFKKIRRIGRIEM